MRYTTATILCLAMLFFHSLAFSQNITLSIDGGADKTGTSLESVLAEISLVSITRLTITAGDFTTADWNYLKANSNNLNSLTHFTITEGITSVADIPDTDFFTPYFRKVKIKEVSIAKVQRIGKYAFADCTSLVTASFPEATSIGTSAFSSCYSLIQLGLGATPPDVNTDAFISTTPTRYLALIDPAGKLLTGVDLALAQKSYDDVKVANNTAGDNQWYGWRTNANIFNVSVGTSINGGVTIPKTFAEGYTFTPILIPDEDHYLPYGSLIVHETGDPTNMISVAENNSFTMPAFDVTITANFIAKPSLELTINGTTSKAGTSLENALTGVSLGDITRLTITAGIFDVADWNYLRNNTDSLMKLTYFTITEGITMVADIPNTGSLNPYFKQYQIKEVRIAKLQRIGTQAFKRCTSLVTASFPSVISIGIRAFDSCHSLVQLSLGDTPPIVDGDAFGFTLLRGRYLTLVDHTGNPLEGGALAAAQVAYDDVRVAGPNEVGDNKWYGWQTNASIYAMSVGTSTNGGVAIPKTFAEGYTVNPVFTPDAGYYLLPGSLVVHKTGDPTNVISVAENNSFIMPAFDVTITATFIAKPSLELTINGTTFKTGTSLENALAGISLGDVTRLTITAGVFDVADWNYLRTNNSNLKSLTHFTITESITSVVDIPDTDFRNRYFKWNKIQEVNIAKVQRIGAYAFNHCTSLTTLSLPAAIYIGPGNLFSCPVLTQLVLGAIPPIVNDESTFFNNASPNRYLTLVDPAGKPLADGALTEAQAAYDDITTVSNTPRDNKWFGWQTNANIFTVSVGTSTNGGVIVPKTSADGYPVTPTFIPDEDYYLPRSSLIVHETGNPVNRVFVATDNSFTMPAFDVTITAAFVAKPSMELTINGTISKTGTSLENTLAGISLEDVTRLTINSGVFDSGDWEYLKTNKGNLANLTHFTITDGITYVENILNADYKDPYFNQDKIEEVSIAKIQHIGKDAFFEYTSLTTVSFPSAISIGRTAFSRCSSLTTVSFPSVITIKESAFFECTSLTTASFPVATSIGGYTFWGCSSLAQLGLGTTLPSMSPENIFRNTPSTRYLALLDRTGKPLTGVALTAAQKAYDDVTEASNKAGDNQWYGFITNKQFYKVITKITGNGLVKITPDTYLEGTGSEKVTFTLIYESEYFVKEGSLKVYKAGNPNIVIAVDEKDNSFTMPAHNVTIEVVFEQRSAGEVLGIGSGDATLAEVLIYFSANRELTITGLNQEQSDIRIISLDGREVLSRMVYGENEVVVPILGVSSHVYVVLVTTARGSKAQKVFVE